MWDWEVLSVPAKVFPELAQTDSLIRWLYYYTVCGFSQNQRFGNNVSSVLRTDYLSEPDPGRTFLGHWELPSPRSLPILGEDRKTLFSLTPLGSIGGRIWWLVWKYVCHYKLKVLYCTRQNVPVNKHLTLVDWSSVCFHVYQYLTNLDITDWG